MKTLPTLLTTIVLLPTFSACSVEDSDKDEFSFDGLLGEGGKADMLSSAHIVREADLNSTFTGDFDSHVRVYGFSVQARVGAVLDIGMLTEAGADSIDAREGESLDTIMAVYGPMQGGQAGDLIVQVDDDASGEAAQLPPIEIEQEGEYLVLLSTWNDPGRGRYIMELTCEGTDFQCRRPTEALPCEEGTEYIMGGQSIGTATWNRCNYVLLEETHVEPEAVLSIEPGVTVKGNYLGEGEHGNVRMVVDGVVQAIGSEEHPVLFTSLESDRGWGGLVLNGRSTLRHAYVENARTGIEVVGDGNRLEDIDINSSQTGLLFKGETEGHRIARGRIAKVANGIVMEQTVVTIEDTVILGLQTGSGVGIQGRDTTASFFRRALVSGFGTGIDLNSAELEMEDATISNNDRGVHVTGEDAGVEPAHTCPPIPNFTSARTQSWPPRPTVFRRDPVFRRVDLVDNAEYAVRIDAPELLVIEDSNVRNNGAGIIIASSSLHDDSRITGNNIHDNGGGLMQLETFHNDGTLDISGNYWAQISDPDLSASWNNTHDDYALPSELCNFSRTRNQTPTCDRVNGDNSHRRCADYDCRRGSTNWVCTLIDPLFADPWTGEVRFTGFSPEALDAGPDDGTLDEDVKQERDVQGL